MDFNFKIVYRPGTKGGKPDALSRWPEYRPKEGATHREQQILKPENFENFGEEQIDGFKINLIHAHNDEGYETMDDERVLVKRMSKDAIIPIKGSTKAAGHDLFSTEDIVIPTRGQAIVGTGVSIGLPEGTYGRIAPRSGLAVRHGINIGAGVIDADYTGELKVLLLNQGATNY